MLTMFIKGLAIFLVIDILWIKFVAYPLYHKAIGKFLNPLMSDPSLLLAAFGVYILLVLGIVVFVMPLTKDMNYLHSGLYGGLYGLIAYGVFALTNYSVLSIWTVELLICDLVWGLIIGSIVTLALKALS